MEVQEKHRLEILNAKCNYVCAVDALVKKSNYGEDIGCCIEKLYLASRIINRLECFCFETPVAVTTEIKSQFSTIVPKENALVGDIIQYFVNDEMVWSTEVLVSVPFSEIFDAIALDLGIGLVITDNGSNYTYIGTLDCNVVIIKNYLTRGGVTSVTVPTNIVAGACATSNPPCYNCIEVSNLPKMYEVLDKLLS